MSRKPDAGDKIRNIIIFVVGMLLLIFIVGEMCPILINSSTNPEGQTALNNACGNILNYYPDFLKLDNLMRLR